MRGWLLGLALVVGASACDKSRPRVTVTPVTVTPLAEATGSFSDALTMTFDEGSSEVLTREVGNERISFPGRCRSMQAIRRRIGQVMARRGFERKPVQNTPGVPAFTKGTRADSEDVMVYVILRKDGFDCSYTLDLVVAALDPGVVSGVLLQELQASLGAGAVS